jgi:hypothetical protein
MPARLAAAFAASRVLGSTPLTLQGKLFAMISLAYGALVFWRAQPPMPLPSARSPANPGMVWTKHAAEHVPTFGRYGKQRVKKRFGFTLFFVEWPAHSARFGAV